jgi:hypothetical protein
MGFRVEEKTLQHGAKNQAQDVILGAKTKTEL